MSNAKQIAFEIDDNGCFNCTSHKPNKDGYRQIQINHQLYIMHRFIYEECFGPIPPGMVVRHKCDNTHCINPAHLEIGTVADNNRDKVERGRCNPVKGEDHGHAKLSHSDVYKIYKQAMKGEYLHQIAQEFNVDKSTIFKIKKGETWKHLRGMFEVLYDVEKERIRQLEKWNIQRHPLGFWLAILMEEVGEVAEAAQSYFRLVSSKDTDSHDLYKELIQVAAVASAVAEQIKEELEGAR
ncbi:HNH endonuclease [Bacillus sp. MUM 116]|uniref:HNH endonuclease n=1 Tax=Bacillus sp. MUM 116 TaxID=1678002 RepID=UPI0009F5C2E4|nr:HNH endonuclease [Bacillus sp. MUM 116]